MPDSLTPEEYADSARKLGNIIDAATERHADEQKRELASRAAMRVLSECCSQIIVQRPPGGADLGAILIAHQFKEVLEEYGLVIMPAQPSEKVRQAFSKGWLRSFQRRFESAMKAAWA